MTEIANVLEAASAFQARHEYLSIRMLYWYMANSFYCPSCDSRQATAGDCSCGDGPFLDLRTQFARDILEGIDEKGRHRHETIHRWLAIVPALATMIALWVFVPDLLRSLSLPLGLDQFIIVGGIGLGYMALFTKLRPFRSRLGLLKEIALDESS